MERVEQICRIHGRYSAERLPIGTRGKTITSPCPKCAEERERKDREREKLQEEQRLQEAIDKSGIPKRFLTCSLDNFRTGDEREPIRALTVARKYLESFPQRHKAGGSLVFCGMPGTGKTHLACAIAMGVIRQGYTALYTTTFRAMAAVKETFGRAEHRDVIKDLLSPSLLVIDEVGVQYGTDTERIIFYQIINGRYEEIRPTILISNLSEKELAEFIGVRCIDRMREGGGAVVSFTWKSYRK